MLPVRCVLASRRYEILFFDDAVEMVVGDLAACLADGETSVVVRGAELGLNKLGDAC